MHDQQHDQHDDDDAAPRYTLTAKGARWLAAHPPAPSQRPADAPDDEADMLPPSMRRAILEQRIDARLARMIARCEAAERQDTMPDTMPDSMPDTYTTPCPLCGVSVEMQWTGGTRLGDRQQTHYGGRCPACETTQQTTLTRGHVLSAEVIVEAIAEDEARTHRKARVQRLPEER